MLTPLREILKAAAKSLGVQRAAYAALVEEVWPEVVGREAAAHTQTAGLRGGTLLVDAEPGPWAQELTAQRARFIEEINRRLGDPVISEIRVRQKPGAYGKRE